MSRIKDFIILILILMLTAVSYFLYVERVNNLEKQYSVSDSLKTELILQQEYFKHIRFVSDSLKTQNNKLDSLNNILHLKLKNNKAYETKLLQNIESFSDSDLYNVFSNEVIN